MEFNIEFKLEREREKVAVLLEAIADLRIEIGQLEAENERLQKAARLPDPLPELSYAESIDTGSTVGIPYGNSTGQPSVIRWWIQ